MRKRQSSGQKSFYKSLEKMMIQRTWWKYEVPVCLEGYIPSKWINCLNLPLFSISSLEQSFRWDKDTFQDTHTNSLWKEKQTMSISINLVNHNSEVSSCKSKIMSWKMLKARPGAQGRWSEVWTTFTRPAMWSVADILTMISDTLSLFMFLSASRVSPGYSTRHPSVWTLMYFSRSSLIKQVDTH